MSHDGIHGHIPEPHLEKADKGLSCLLQPNLGLGTSVVNLSSETLSDDEMAILSKGMSFIPTPHNVDKDSIMTSVNNFQRKIKLSYFWSQKQLKDKLDNDYKKLPFTNKSTWNPPECKIPPKVHDILSNLNNEVKNLETTKDKNNLSVRQISALKSLNKKTHLIIKKADKGSCCVVMDKINYIKEAERQLNNDAFYKKIDAPIYPETSIKYRDILSTMLEKKLIQPEQACYLMPSNDARSRRFYLLPKIHKDMSKWTIKNKMPPGRPIVSDCSSESYRIAEYLDYHLQPIACKHPSYVKDTYDFLDKLKHIKVPDNAYLITLDIESLYTNIQTHDGIESVKKMFLKHPSSTYFRPEKEIIDLLELSLKCNDFVFNDQWYLQISGTAMGKKFAPSYANIDMAIFEEEVLNLTDKKPLAYFRFLDDIFLIWQHSLDDFKQFFELLNNHRESIKFQYLVSNTAVNFLDVTVFKGNQYSHMGTLDTKVYFKPTDTHELLHKSSFHPKHTFEGIVKSQLIRFWRISSDTNGFEEACTILFETLRKKRNYSRRYLRKIKSNTVDMLIACRSTISPVGVGIGCAKRRCECCLYIKTASEFGSKFCVSEFTITGRITCNSKNILYLIECKKCEEQYVGETSKTLRARLTDHISDINRYCNTSVAEHFNQISHDGINDLYITPIVQMPDLGSKMKNSLARRKYESFFIKKLRTMSPDGMNEKLEEFGTLSFPIVYSNTGAKVTRLIRQTYETLQEEYPKHFKDKLVIAYKRNKNLSDKLISSKL